MKRMRLMILAVSAVVSMLGACNPAESSTVPATNVSKATAPFEAEATATQTEVPAKTELDLDSADPSAEMRDATDKMVFAQTNLQPDGNRIVGGTGNIPALTAQDVPLEGRPTWVIAAPVDGGLLWVAVLEEGRTQAFFVHNGQVEPYAVTPDQIPAGMPPLLQFENGEATIIVPNGESSLLTHPVSINSTGDIAYIDASGNLVVQQADIPMTLPVNAQPDARILVDENGRLLLHTDPTDEYGHGIMGDKLEAGSMTLVTTKPELKIVRKIPTADRYVLEGIAPIWVDLDGDGMREIVVTRSNANDGAQIVLLDEVGNLLATGPTIGQGGRWRHQLSAGPFGPNGEMELVDVLTPHIGGPTEFFRWQEDELVIAATINGFTSHVIGSRNLDMNAAGQFDDSGHLTVLLPNQARTELGGIQRSVDGAQVAWTLPLSGQLVTNIAAAPLADGRLAVGIGQANNILRIWQP